MFLTSYASVFILKDSVWVSIKEDLSWAYIRLRTVTSKNAASEDAAPSTSKGTLMLTISSNKDFAPSHVVLETQVISSSKWILVADDFAEFEVDQQRYGAYFENDKTATAFTGAIAEGLQEIRSGVFTTKNDNESTIDRHTGIIKQKQSKETTGGEGKKTKRRKSLAQFEDVNEAIASMCVSPGAVTVTETVDLAGMRGGLKEGGGEGGEGRHSDLSTITSTSHSEDLDFGLAIEKQMTTVYNRDSVKGAFKRFGKSMTSRDDSSPAKRHTIAALERSGSSGEIEVLPETRPTTVSVDNSSSTRPPKKNSLTLSTFTSIFRKPQKSATPEVEAEYEQNKELPPPPLADRRKLGCLPYRGGDSDDTTDISVAQISAPEAVLHMTSVHFNDTLGRYEGLPEEWKVQNRVFGLPLQTLPKRMDTAAGEYTDAIPTVLILFREHLLRLNAQSIVGIFRLAPDKDECNAVKDLINLGEYDYNECKDPNILANLLKVFFRELPQNLFNSIPDREILKIASLESLEEIMAEMGADSPLLTSPHHSLILWLLDFMAVFVLNEHVNKMSAKNMAIVVSPNLYAVSSENPMVALTMAQKVAEFTTKILAGRLKMKFDYDIGMK